MAIFSKPHVSIKDDTPKTNPVLNNVISIIDLYNLCLCTDNKIIYMLQLHVSKTVYNFLLSSTVLF